MTSIGDQNMMITTKRGSSLTGPFLLVVVLFAAFLCYRYFYFADFQGAGSNDHAVAKMVHAVENHHNLTKEAADARALGLATAEDYLDVPPSDSTDSNSNETCQPQVRYIVQEKPVAVPVKVHETVFKQWYAKNRPWHAPGKFPLCTMDTCFDYKRCEDKDELLVYHYDVPISPDRYFQGFNNTQWFTSDPESACLFFVFQDLDSPWRPHPRDLPYWNNGINHVLITFADLWWQRNPGEDTIGNASILATLLYETTYRPGFDIGIPLPGRSHFSEFRSLKPLERKYFLTFKGTRYLHKPKTFPHEGSFRSFPSLREMYNGEDIIVVLSCSHAINDIMRKEDPNTGINCEEDQKRYDMYSSYSDLFNSTFALAPAGKSGSSYRFIEVISAGSIPVLIADNHVKPFENLIQWPRCALQFPTTEMKRIVPTLRKMSVKEMEERQKYCLWAYNEFLKDDETLLRAVMRSLKVRFYGVLPKFSEAATSISADDRKSIERRKTRRFRKHIL